MSSSADLYLDEIDLERYFAKDTCMKCGAHSCKELLEKIRAGTCLADDLSALKPGAARALRTVALLEIGLPEVPVEHLPRLGPHGLTELNAPSDGDPILLTGNNRFTQEVLAAVLSSTSKAFYFLSVDTRGDPIDMAVILRTFTPETILRSLDNEGLNKKAPSSPLVIPGRTCDLAQSVASATKRQVIVGPVCAAELPLFYGDSWQAAE